MTEVFKMPHILSLNILIGTRAYQKHRALKYLNDDYDIKIAQTKGSNTLNSEGQRIIENLKQDVQKLEDTAQMVRDHLKPSDKMGEKSEVNLLLKMISEG